MSEGKKDDLLTRYKKALEGLTPGGSEFHDSPETCADFVRDRLSFTVQQQKRITELVKALEAVWSGVSGRLRAQLDDERLVPMDVTSIPVLYGTLRAIRAALTAAGRGK